MVRTSIHGPKTQTEQTWWETWIDPNTQESFMDMSDGVVPKCSKIKRSLLSDAERAAANKYDRLSEQRKWLWAAFRGAEVTKRIRTHTDEQKANATKNLAALRAKDEVGFKAKKAKHMADSRARRTPEKKEQDKKRALALLTAKDDADPSRVTKRKERHSELGKAKRLTAKENLQNLLGQIAEL